MRFAADIEADNLLEGITTIHCMSVQPEGGAPVLAVGKQQIRILWRRMIAKASAVVFHNGVGYDLPALHKVLGLKLPDGIEIIDTMLLSQVLFADRTEGHSLEQWGKDTGVMKESYEDWCAEQGVDPWAEYRPEMGSYNMQDCRATWAVLHELEREKAEQETFKLNPMAAYAIELAFAKDFAVQGMRGVKVDKPFAEALLTKIVK